MYSVHGVSLGEGPAEPSMWDSLTKLATTGITAGFNIYNKTQQLKSAQQQSAAAQTAAQNQIRMMSVMPSAQAGYQAPGMFDGMMMPLLIGGGVLALVVFMKMKK